MSDSASFVPRDGLVDKVVCVMGCSGATTVNVSSVFPNGTVLRDAYSGEPLDASRPLVRCDACQSVYHADSARVLARENGGRCVSCNSTGFCAVRVVAD